MDQSSYRAHDTERTRKNINLDVTLWIRGSWFLRNLLGTTAAHMQAGEFVAELCLLQQYHSSELGPARAVNLARCLLAYNGCESFER